MEGLRERLLRAEERVAEAALAAGRRREEITLCAATKTQTSDTIRAAIAGGITVCGENRVQELTAHLADDAYRGARVHFIGHLQTNKVKFVVGQVDLIESVDSPRLLEAVDRQAAKLGLIQDILLEVNIAREESKGGCPPEALMDLAGQALRAGHVRLRGLMCIPPAAARAGGNVGYFRAARQFYVDIRNKMGDNVSDMDCLSMGMSGDYQDAVREGATLVRVGTALFGPRPPLGG